DEDPSRGARSDRARACREVAAPPSLVPVVPTSPAVSGLSDSDAHCSGLDSGAEVLPGLVRPWPGCPYLAVRQLLAVGYWCVRRLSRGPVQSVRGTSPQSSSRRDGRPRRSAAPQLSVRRNRGVADELKGEPGQDRRV